MLLEKINTIYESNNFCVLKCKVIGENDPQCQINDSIVISGNDIVVADFCLLEAKGYWKNSKYGLQFAVQDYEEIIPKNYKAICGFLNSGRIDGITPAITELIYKQFRNETIEVLDQNASRIYEVLGITTSTANQIRFSYEKERFYKKVLCQFKKYRFSENVLKKIFSKYGKETMDIINQDPYVLCQYGLGIKDVDKIASNDKICEKAKAVFLLTLKEWERKNGNICMPYNLYPLSVKKNAQKYGVKDEILSEAEEELLSEKKVIYYDNMVYRAEIFEIENRVAKELYRIDKSYKLPKKIDIQAEIDKSEKLLNCKLHIQQRLAVEYAIKCGVLVITGGPGTGKTTVIKVIANIQERIFGRTLAFLAPTGRAASRMKESCGRPSYTIHRFLNLGVETDYTQRNSVSIQEDCTFCDEVSMLDVYVASALFSSVQSGKQLILFGDVNQLPSVGPGAVLKDMIDSGMIPTVYLTKVFRQSSNSNIYLNCQKIVRGNLSLEYGDDFVLWDAYTQEEAADLMADAFCEEVKKWGLKNVCCLTPYRKITPTGSVAMNKTIQELLNPKKENVPELFYKPGDTVFRIGDRVMSLVNTTDVCNGDLGFITEIENQCVTVEYEELQKTYSYDELDQIRLAYAMTIHKSQGSEFLAIVSTLLESHGDMLQMNLFNTVVSRAKKKFILIGNEKAIKIAILNKGNICRYTGLRKKIQLIWSISMQNSAA